LDFIFQKSGKPQKSLNRSFENESKTKRMCQKLKNPAGNLIFSGLKTLNFKLGT
jgi:hypothetical protein